MWLKRSQMKNNTESVSEQVCTLSLSLPFFLLLYLLHRTQFICCSAALSLGYQKKKAGFFPLSSPKDARKHMWGLFGVIISGGVFVLRRLGHCFVILVLEASGACSPFQKSPLVMLCIDLNIVCCTTLATGFRPHRCVAARWCENDKWLRLEPEL